MISRAFFLLGSAFFCVFAASASGENAKAQLARPAVDRNVTPASPHAFMDLNAACVGCHMIFFDKVDPHSFSMSMVEKCHTCHTGQKLGISHPVGVDPSRSEMEITVPDEIPLEDGKVSCGSCHQPHADWLSKTRSFKDQPPYVSPGGTVATGFFKTYFARISDPVEGFAPLCLACHKDF